MMETLIIAVEYVINRPKEIRVFQVCHKKNEGPGIARSIGIKMSKGYLTFADSDDWIESSMYEEMIKVAIRMESDIVGCPSIVDFDDGSHRENLSDIYDGYIGKKQCIVDFLEDNKHAWVAVHNKIYKSILWKDIRFPAVNHLEDYAVGSKLFNEANSIWFCAHPYYHYTFNSTSLSKSRWNPKRSTILETTNAIIDYLRSNCSEPSMIKATYRFRLFNLA